MAYALVGALVTVVLAACGDPADKPFTCAKAAAILGHPTANVEACDPAPHLAEVYQVALAGGDLPARQIIGIHLTNGVLDPGRGDAALSAFLDGLGPRRDALTMQDMIAVLRAFEAFPPGLDGSSSMFDLPAIGTSRFAPQPFALELYNGHPPEPGFVRARLTGPPWAWTRGELADGATEWKDGPAVPLTAQSGSGPSDAPR